MTGSEAELCEAELARDDRRNDMAGLAGGLLAQTTGSQTEGRGR
jgi:hypothetical protein